MAGYGDVRAWQPGPLDDAEQQLKSRSDTLLGLADELAASAKPDDWHGLAAERATLERNQITDGMEHIVAGVSAARSALMMAADRVTELRNMVMEIEGLAQAHQFSIDDTGAIVDGGTSPGMPADHVAERARVKAELADRVTQILRYARRHRHDLRRRPGQGGAGQGQ